MPCTAMGEPTPARASWRRGRTAAPTTGSIGGAFGYSGTGSDIDRRLYGGAGNDRLEARWRRANRVDLSSQQDFDGCYLSYGEAGADTLLEGRGWRATTTSVGLNGTVWRATSNDSLGGGDRHALMAARETTSDGVGDGGQRQHYLKGDAATTSLSAVRMRLCLFCWRWHRHHPR